MRDMGNTRTQLIWGYRGTLGTQLIWEHREMRAIGGHEGYRQYGNMRDMEDTADMVTQGYGEHGHMGATATR